MEGYMLFDYLCMSIFYNPKVFGEIQGNLLGARGPRDLSYKYLLVPTLTHWTERKLPDQYVVSMHVCA